MPAGPSSPPPAALDGWAGAAGLRIARAPAVPSPPLPSTLPANPSTTPPANPRRPRVQTASYRAMGLVWAGRPRSNHVEHALEQLAFTGNVDVSGGRAYAGGFTREQVQGPASAAKVGTRGSRPRQGVARLCWLFRGPHSAADAEPRLLVYGHGPVSPPASAGRQRSWRPREDPWLATAWREMAIEYRAKRRG